MAQKVKKSKVKKSCCSHVTHAMLDELFGPLPEGRKATIHERMRSIARDMRLGYESIERYRNRENCGLGMLREVGKWLGVEAPDDVPLAVENVRMALSIFISQVNVILDSLGVPRNQTTNVRKRISGALEKVLDARTKNSKGKSGTPRYTKLGMLRVARFLRQTADYHDEMADVPLSLRLLADLLQMFSNQFPDETLWLMKEYKK